MPRGKVLDRWLLSATVLTAAFGVVMVASASASLARQHYGVPGEEFALRQLLAVLLGGAAMLAAMLVPLDRLLDRRIAFGGLALTWLALAAAYLQPPIAGTHRWLALPFGSIQPSAIAKVTLPLAIAVLIASRAELGLSRRNAFRAALAVVAVTVALVLGEPDLGSAVLLAVAALAILLVAGVPWRTVVIAGVAALPVLVMAIALKPYRMERVRSFFGSTSYQVHQSLIALGRGGLVGQGPGESVQKLFYLPQPHTDFVFAIAGEELGFLGATAIMALLGVVTVRGFVAAQHAATEAHALLATGLATAIGVQALLNVSVCLNLVPAKGLPLPLVSAGGSDVLLTMAGIGLLLNIGKEGV